ncbi:MAG: hypothetical protein NWE92_07485 [Candidatus Bathyarchaeota archaeon]|nr:hypothetical protein [Candidatus Bathyarchaeota archaeon]
MERKPWSVHFDMETSEEPIQNKAFSAQKAAKKKRSQADKVGKLKYLLAKDKKLDRDVAEIKLMLRVIFAGLKDSLYFEKSLIEAAACEDEVDRAILQLLFEAGASGMLPKDIAAKLVEFKVARHQVTRRIVRMNKRLAKELDSAVVERRGWCWAMTSFGVDAYKASEKDLLSEGVTLHGTSEEET